MLALYELTQTRMGEYMKFLALIHGAKIEGSPKSETTSTKSFSSEDQGLFKHPDYYKDMDPEEREKLTQAMMGLHKSAMLKTPLGRKL